ncbi:MAG: sugar-binding transcriptional regulator [Clostridia bacterium]|nr:sugar-binding transcriptional regulator [Clostridia bacterium]
MEYEEALMAKVAWYYYYEELTQQQISERLGMSRMRVVKLLDRARRTGVIRFHLREGSQGRMELEKQLIQTYSLTDAFIVPAGADKSRCNENIAEAASMYLSERIRSDTVINIGYGDTLSRVLNNLATLAEQTISCVSLTGGVSCYLPDARSNVFNARLHLMPAPLLASSAEMAQAMRREDSVQEIARMIPLSHLTLVGIGSMDESATIFHSGILNANDMLYLRMRGAAGDLLSHFLTRDGQLIESPVEERLIGASLDTLRSLRNVIGIAAGTVKAEAIRAALLGGYLDTLITDEETALRILQLEETA